MKKILILNILILLSLLSCDNKTIITYYETGDKKEEIYLNDNLDTVKTINFFKTGDTCSIKYFTVNYTTTKSNVFTKSGFLQKIRLTKNGKLHGIQHVFYKDKFKNQIGYFVNGKVIGHVSIVKNKKGYNKLFAKWINDTLALQYGEAFYNKSNKLIKDSSFCYIVKGNNYVNKGEDYTFEINLITDRYGIDSVFTEVGLGTLDTNYTLSDIYYSEGGYLNSYNVILHNPSLGYNFIQGKISLLGVKDSTIVYVKEMLFFHDFYVEPTDWD